MSLFTTFFNLIKPQKTDPQAVAQLNSNFDTIDTEMHRPPLTVNDVEPDPTTRNLYLEEVPLAGNLSSDIAQLVTGTFIERTTGGSASVDDGDASLISVKGNMIHTGYVPESINMTVTPAQREEGVAAIAATLDRDTFVAYVQSSGTITLTYSSDWSADPALYGITVEGTPVAGDVITVVYVKEDRGTITTANPTSFNSTGWNLFDLTAGYARVVKYSDSYGYYIGGTYSLIEFATTPTGSRTAITVTSGYFSVPSDGYVIITGGDATTYIYATWSDWIGGYEGNFESYTVDTIDLTEVMVSFPYGLLAVGNVRDEINLNSQVAVSRVRRLAYSAENLAAIIESGVDYDADTNYIYAVRTTPVTSAIDVDGFYSVDDHGIEFLTGTSVPVIVETLYGENLKDKLRTDVLTISAQTLDSTQKAQVQSNIGLVPTQATNITASGYVADARVVKTLSDQIGTLNSKIAINTITLTTTSDASLSNTQSFESNGIVTISGTFRIEKSNGLSNGTMFSIESGKKPLSGVPSCAICAFNDSGTPIAYGFAYIDNGNFIAYFNTSVAYHSYVRFCITYKI